MGETTYDASEREGPERAVPAAETAPGAPAGRTRGRSAVVRALRRAAALALSPLREGQVDTTGLPDGVRRLVWLGYELTGICLLAALLLPYLNPLVGAYARVEYQTLATDEVAAGVRLILTPLARGLDLLTGWLMPMPGRGAPQLMRIGVLLPAMLLATGALLAGWAFVLTGASDCGRRIFFPTLAVFFWSLVLLVWGIAERAVLIPVAGVLVVALAVLHQVTRTRRVWREYPLIELAIWLGIGAAFTVALVGIGNANYEGRGLEALAWGLERTLILVALLWLPALLLGGVEVVELGVSVGRQASRALAGRLPGRGLLLAGWLAPLGAASAWLSLVTAEFGSPGAIRSPLDLLGLVLVVLVVCGPAAATLLWVLVWTVRRRWDRRAAAGAVTLAVASLVVLLTALVAYDDQQDLIEWAIFQAAVNVETIGSSLSYFTVAVLLLTYNVATFGARYANREGRRLIRQGRVLMHFGVLLLMLACGLFFSAHVGRAGTTQHRLEPVLQLGLGLGVFLVAPAYFYWTARRPDRLEPGPERVSGSGFQVSRSTTQPPET